MNNLSQGPIGIFDSGIGGLTVAHAIARLLPHEHFIYFGDTIHLPYGDKSEAAIQAYSVKIAELLLKKGCKVIVIACNSASSAAYELLKEYVRKDAHIINVIDPMIDYIGEHCPNETIGLIGTKRTVESGVYAMRASKTNKNITLKSLATPLLAPMIEEGFFNNQISHEVISQYLSHPAIQAIDSLILGCTHYPLIKKEIEMYYHKKVKVLDSSEIVAQALKTHLLGNNLLNEGQEATRQFFVSDFTPSFQQSTRQFFGELAHLQLHKLWN